MAARLMDEAPVPAPIGTRKAAAYVTPEYGDDNEAHLGVLVMMRGAVIVLVTVTVAGVTLALTRDRPDPVNHVVPGRSETAAGGRTDDIPITTAPPLPGESAPTVTTIGEDRTAEPGEGWEFAVTQFMEEFDVSAEVADDMLETQGTLSDYAEKVRHEPGYAGFMLVNEPPVVSGVLAVTPGAALSPPPDLPIRVVEPASPTTSCSTSTPPSPRPSTRPVLPM